jgi:phosphatidylinositol alpha 1,6-mannosyltransferase
VNSELFNPTKRSAELRNSWDPSGKRTIIGYVGRIANEKRISDLRFIARDPNIQLVITGEGPARAKLEKEIPSAIFTGFQSGEDLARIYASLDLFIHPGPNETFCQSVQEALASGVPCIVPTTGGPADLVTHGTTGYVMNIHRPDELEAAVLHFRLRNDRNEMSRLARESVEQRTWSAINSELLNHYNEVIDQKHNQVDEVVA